MVVKRGHYTRFASYCITRTIEAHDPDVQPARWSWRSPCSSSGADSGPRA